MKITFLLSLILVLFGGSISSQSPAATNHPGVVLYKQQKFSEAIDSLEKATKSGVHKRDADLWNYLGLCYYASDDLKKAVKAFEKSVDLNGTSSTFRANLAYAYMSSGLLKKAQSAAEEAVRLDVNNPSAYRIRSRSNLYDNAFGPAERDADILLRLDPTDPLAYLTKSDVLVAMFVHRVNMGSPKNYEVELLKRAVDTLEAGLSKVKSGSNTKRMVEELGSLKLLHTSFSKEPRSPGSPPIAIDPNVTPYKILNKPRPAYTDKARAAGIEGAVRLSVILGADGKVQYILPLNKLGYGLDQSAMNAARRIQFEPKRIDGKPVPTIVTVEYGFEIH